MSDTLIETKGRYKLPPGPGRPKGVPNKVSREIRAIAADYGPDAVRRLAVLGGLVPKGGLRPGEKAAASEATQAVCLGHVLNRAYGFPSQPLSHSADESFETLLDRLERRRLGKLEPSKMVEFSVVLDGLFAAPQEHQDGASTPTQTAETNEAGEPLALPEDRPEPEPITDWLGQDDDAEARELRA